MFYSVEVVVVVMFLHKITCNIFQYPYTGTFENGIELGNLSEALPEYEYIAHLATGIDVCFQSGRCAVPVNTRLGAFPQWIRKRTNC